MTKESIKVYLDVKDKRKLLEKAEAVGLRGRGALSQFISFVAQNEIVFLDENVKKVLRCVSL